MTKEWFHYFLSFRSKCKTNIYLFSGTRCCNAARLIRDPASRSDALAEGEVAVDEGRVEEEPNRTENKGMCYAHLQNSVSS